MPIRFSYTAAMILIGAAAACGAAENMVLPALRSGKHPVSLPTYTGIDQLMVLSDRWIVVVSVDVPDVVKRVDELSGGRLTEAVEGWDASEKAGKPNWTFYKSRTTILFEHFAKARDEVGERRLDDPATYSVTSADDPAYPAPKRPSRVARTIVGLDGQIVPGGPDQYGHYCYVELPEPMQEGKTYGIEIYNGKKATWLFDGKRTVTRSIKVNQIGYLPDAPRKCAYLGGFLLEFGPLDCSAAKTFAVINADTGAIAFSGSVVLREKNPRFGPTDKETDQTKRPLMYGEDVYELDFTGLKEEGNFFISVPGFGRSWTFRHHRDAFGEAFYLAARGFFHQRGSFALEHPYTAWTRPRHHTDPVYECENVIFPPHLPRPKGYEHFDVIGATIDTSRATPDLVGGWYDAADWDRNAYHYSCVFDLLRVFEMFPGKFTDGQLNLPESGNGIPDLLDEAEFGLRIWARSMDERGGVSGYVETWTHPTVDADVKYAFSQRTRWTSLVFSAAAATYSRLVRPYQAEGADAYAALARKAYDFSTNPANSLGRIAIHARKNRGKGDPYSIPWEETDDQLTPYLIMAKGAMFRLTGEASYLDGIAELVRIGHKPLAHHFGVKDYSIWSYTDLLAAGDVIDQQTRDFCTAFYRDTAKEYASHTEANPYRMTLPRRQDYWLGWGASCMTNYNRALAIGRQLGGGNDLRAAEIANVDFMFGANPKGMTWTTGIGSVYPVIIQHASSELDGVLDPYPGITVYGITGGPSAHLKVRDQIWDARIDKNASATPFLSAANRTFPLWRCYMAHPTVNTAQCEFTVHETMAGTVFALAALMSDGWMPDEELKKRGPRPDSLLFGYYPLP